MWSGVPVRKQELFVLLVARIIIVVIIFFCFEVIAVTATLKLMNMRLNREPMKHSNLNTQWIKNNDIC